jgi:hypothetical protein
VRSILPWLAVAVVAAACGEGPESGPDAGGADAAPVGQGSPPTGDLIVNEIAPRPSDGPDWIEIVNRSDAPIDLCGYFVTDSLDRLDHYAPLGGVMPPAPCDALMLEPGGYWLVNADDVDAPFKLSTADEVHIVTITGLAVDSLVYLYPPSAAGESLARIPNAEGLFWLAGPSPGDDNE